MSESDRVRRTAAASLVLLAGLGLWLRPACADPSGVLDSQSILRSLRAAPAGARALVVGPRTAPAGERKVTLDVRFANNSDQLTPAAHAQLSELGTALSSPELAHTRFMIAGHTSATGPAEHNRRLSAARAQAVRSYLLQRFGIAPERIEATGFGASQPLADFPPEAVQQRRVEIIALPPAS